MITQNHKIETESLSPGGDIKGGGRVGWIRYAGRINNLVSKVYKALGQIIISILNSLKA